MRRETGARGLASILTRHVEQAAFETFAEGLATRLPPEPAALMAWVNEMTVSADTAADVFAELRHRHGSSEPLGHCKVAINDEMADWDATISDGDTVFLFPPVAGG